MKPSRLTDEQWAEVQQWEAAGVSRPEQVQRMQERWGVTYTRAFLSLAHGPRKNDLPPEPGTKVFKVYLTDEQMRRLRAMAKSFGYVEVNQTGNLTRMLRAIDAGELGICPARSTTIPIG